jgi:hypothetical protein
MKKISRMYSIEIDYHESDSFDAWDSTEEVGMNWASLEKAQLAMTHINEHIAAMKEQLHDDCRQSPQEFFDVETIRNKPWFYHGDNENYEFNWQHTVLVQRDNGETAGINNFWIGYFQKPYAVKVVTTKDESKECEDVRIYHD